MKLPAYELWLAATFADAVKAPLAERHHALWRWGWSLRYERPAASFVAVWPRGGAKSTTAELLVIACGRRRTRRFVLYVSGTQAKANEHVNNIAEKLESAALKQQDPDLSRAYVNQYGNRRAWGQSGQARVHTAAGFTVYAYGLDVGIRGIKMGDIRPDLIILDDIDDVADSPAIIASKLTAITQSILPAGAPWATVLAVQNLIHADSIFSQLTDGRAEFLYGRLMSGPHRAIDGLVVHDAHASPRPPPTPPATGGLATATPNAGVPTPSLERNHLSPPSFGSDHSTSYIGRRYTITGGTPTWAGQPLTACEDFMNQYSLRAFLHEMQHEVEAPEGGVFEHVVFEHCAPAAVPPLVMTVVAVDPATTDGDRSDANGVQVAGIATDKTQYVLWSWERRASPRDTMLLAVEKAIEYRAAILVVETVQGGKTWDVVFKDAVRTVREAGRWPKEYREPQFLSERSGVAQQNKVARWLLMLTDYERGKMVHVTDAEGTWQTLEKALRRANVRKPFDLADCAFWTWNTLRRRYPIDRSAFRVPVRKYGGPPGPMRGW